MYVCMYVSMYVCLMLTFDLVLMMKSVAAVIIPPTL